MYDSNSRFYVFDCDNDVVQVIDGYENLIRLTYSHIKAGTIGDSFNKLVDYYNPYDRAFVRVKEKIDYVICDVVFRVVPVQRIIQDKDVLNIYVGYSGRRYRKKGSWEFRKDPVPGTGNGRWHSYWRHPKTTQERKITCSCNDRYTRGKRRNLPNTWDDIRRSDILVKHSWKKLKKRKQWMKKGDKREQTCIVLQEEHF